MPLVNMLNGQMTREQANEVIRALEAKGVTRPCPRCGNPHFTLLEGFFNQPLSGDLAASGTVGFSSGPTVPSIVTVCAKCGFLSQHALGVLGLLHSADKPAFGLAG